MKPHRGIVELFEEIRRTMVRKMGLALVFSTISCVIVGLILAWIWVGSDGWRQGVQLPLVIDVSIILLVLGAILIYRNLSVSVSEESAIVDSMEKGIDLPPGLLLGSLQLERNIPKGVSLILAGHASETTLKILRDSKANLYGSRGTKIDQWKRCASISLVVLGLTVCVLTLVEPQRSHRAWSGLFTPLELSAKPSLPLLIVFPGTADFLRGSDVIVTVNAAEREQVTLFRQTVGDVLIEEKSPVQNAQALFTLRGLNAATEYWIVASDGSESDRFLLNPTDPLLVTDLRLTIDYPTYTGRFTEEYRGQIPHLVIPRGSRIGIEGMASGLLEKASLLLDGEEKLNLDVDSNLFEGTFIPAQSEVYSWSFSGINGDPAVLFPQPLEVTVVADLTPEVEVLIPGKDTLLAISRMQPLVVQSSDDYGIQNLEIAAYKTDVFGGSTPNVIQSIPIGGTRSALVHPVLDFTSWELLPGDTIHYFVRAFDNAPSQNIGVTNEYLLLPRTRAEIERDAEEALTAVAGKVEELQDRILEELQTNQDLETASTSQRSEQSTGNEQREILTYEDQQEFRDALDVQRQLLQTIDSLENELTNLSENIDLADLGDVDLEEDLGELENLMSELVPQDALEQLEEFLDNMGEMEADRAREMFRELVEDQESLSERLESVQNRFQKAALDQNFRATAAKTEELAEQQNLLAEAITESAETDIRAQQQEGLQERIEDLGTSLRELEEQLQQMGETTAIDAMSKIQERNDRAKQAMSEAARELRQGNISTASPKAQEAGAELSQMASELQKAQEEMAGQSMQVNMEALRQTATNALSMASEQADLREEMRGGQNKTAQEFRGDELALLMGLQAMADGLTQTLPYGTEQSRMLSTQIGRAMMALEETLESLDSQRGVPNSSPPAADQVIDALNQLAMVALAAGQQAGQNGQEGSGQETMEELQQLADQQGSVNSQTGQLKPMQIGEQTMANQLQDLAGAQEEIADQLSDLADSSEDGSALGNLDEMALEAMRLAEMLTNNRLSPETLRRQERLFQRLLDAGRSLEQDEFSEERESEVPGEFERDEVRELNDGDMGLLTFKIPGPDVMNKLSPALRLMVLEYFDRINKSAIKPGGSFE